MRSCFSGWNFPKAIPVCLFILFSALKVEANTEEKVEEEILTLLNPVIDLFAGNDWLQGLSVILITFLVASFLTWLLFKISGWIMRLIRFDLDDSIMFTLKPPVYYSFLVAGVLAGIQIMPLSEKVTLILSRGIHTLGVVIWVYFFIRFASLFLKKLAQLSDKYTFIQNRTITLFDNAAKIVIFGVGIYVIFVIWKIDMTAWLASAGIAGIAIGFAAKDTLSNLFSGVFILADAPYKVGDYIVLDNGSRGKVTNIGLRSTRVLTRDDIEITIPNLIIGNNTIINQSGGGSAKMRIRIPVGVAYGTDVDLVRSILVKIAKENPFVCKIPEPRVRFRVFGASSLDFELLCWVDDPEFHGRTLDGLNDAIYKAFAEKNVEIPYAKQDLYIKGLPENMHFAKEE